MKIYYDKFAPEWNEAKVSEQISNLENWDILDNNELVGAIRIELDNQICFLRDLQVCSKKQNNGIGSMAIEYVSKLASQNSATSLSLRVFKISPAYRLYKRAGFKTIKEDERFYHMEKNLPIQTNIID